MRSSLRLKHLNVVRRGGQDYVYYRPKGQKGVRLPSLPFDDPRFLAAYAEAAGETPRAPVLAGSLAEAVRDYKASEEFKALAASTRNSRRRMLDEIAERYGSGRIADLRQRHIQRDLDRFTGHAANSHLKMWRALCRWLIDTRRLASDPSDDIRKRPTARTDGHAPWTASDVSAFRQRWPIGTAERLAFELIFWTGARVSDAVRLGAGNIDRDGWLVFTQQKTGGEVAIPFDRELPEIAAGMAEDLAFLHRAIAERPERHLVWMATRQGAARSSKSVSQWFSAKAREAGVTDKTAHGLRKSRAIALVEAGATPHQVGAWTGHSTLAEITHYAARFSKRKALSPNEDRTQSSKFLGKSSKSQ